MNTLEHDELIELLSRAPRAAVETLRSTGQVDLPEFSTIRVEPGDLRELVPPARNVDVVLLLDDEDRTVFALLIEVQAGRDDDKPFTWPYYQSSLRVRFRCPACLMVLALNEKTAEWAQQPVATGQPGQPFVPVVVRKEQFPRVTDPNEARREPYAAILATLLHGHEPGAEHLAVAAAAGAQALPIDERDMWLELMAVSLNEVSRKALEAMMNIEQFRDQSVWFKQGEQRGLQQGEQRGKLEPLRRLFTRRLGRALTASEEQRLSERVATEGVEGASDAVLDLDAAALARWLAD